MTLYTEDQALDAICWSADGFSPSELLATLDRMPKLRLVKIDRLFIDTHGPGIFGILRDDFPRLSVFFDAKYAEIPTKLAQLAKVGCGTTSDSDQGGRHSSIPGLPVPLCSQKRAQNNRHYQVSM